MQIEDASPELVSAVRQLFAEYEIEPSRPIRQQLLKMSMLRAQAYTRKLAALPGSDLDKDQAILAVRATTLPKPLPPGTPFEEPLRQRTVLTDAAGQPVRITSKPGERVVVTVTDVSFVENVLTLTARVLEGATEVIE